MWKIWLFLFSLFITGKCLAQQQHFIYLQTENKQPFYVRTNNQVYSSSSSGYLILSKLADTTYTLFVGFPKNEWPEQTFLCEVSGNDAGYLIKNFKEKGWVLLNLRTYALQYPITEQKPDSERIQVSTDAFSSLLAEVVNDPTLKQVAVTSGVKKSKSSDNEDSFANKTSVIITGDTATRVNGQVIPFNNTIQKVGTNITAGGIEITYIDKNGVEADSIKILLENPFGTSSLTEDTVIAAKQVWQDTMAISKPRPEEKTDTRFLDIEWNKPTDTLSEKNMIATIHQPNVDSAKNIPVSLSDTTENSKVVPDVNIPCKEQAQNSDMAKLKKKLSAAGNVDAMINIANKFFKAKCYSTAQVRELSDMFLGDEDTYRFLDVAYPYVTDVANFPMLENLLTDKYYINRFKAMLK